MKSYYESRTAARKAIAGVLATEDGADLSKDQRHYLLKAEEFMKRTDEFPWSDDEVERAKRIIEDLGL